MTLYLLKFVQIHTVPVVRPFKNVPTIYSEILRHFSKLDFCLHWVCFWVEVFSEIEYFLETTKRLLKWKFF